MSKIDNFEDLFCHQLSDLLNAETQMTKALKETEDQIEKVKKAFASADMEPEKITCEAMKGLIKEGKEAIDEFEPGPLLDCALIIAAQKVEHYEIAGYGSVCALADKLGLEEAKNLLGSILDQEKATDEKLTAAALNINEEAADYVEAAE